MIFRIILLALALVLHFIVIDGVTQPIKPFSIEFSSQQIQDMKARLKSSLQRFPERESSWDYGTDPEFMRQMTKYWATNYPFEKRIALMNSMPQFTTQVDGLDIHFVHKRSSRTDAVPLLISHGWPGSFLECNKIIDELANPVNADNPAYHVVCPSIPGYGFSGYRADIDHIEVGKIFAKLMAVLEYDYYVVQGGDWGSMIVTHMALNDPEHCKAVHLNFIGTPPPFTRGVVAGIKTFFELLFPSWFMEPAEAEFWSPNGLVSFPKFFWKQAGYLHYQATYPSTLGMAVGDSPVGIASWIWDKFYTWSDCGDDLLTVYTKDELIDFIMVYWIPNSFETSLHLYYELMNGPNDAMKKRNFYVDQPTAFAIFPKEAIKQPRHWLEYYYNLTGWTRFAAGGHFAALEQPTELIHDMRRHYVASGISLPADSKAANVVYSSQAKPPPSSSSSSSSSSSLPKPTPKKSKSSKPSDRPKKVTHINKRTGEKIYTAAERDEL